MSDRSNKLLNEINEAVAAANKAEETVTTAQAELVSRSKTVGLLLLEAKKQHPAVKDFDAFLKRVKNLSLSRAYDLMRLAGGRTTDEELKKEARERKQRSREKKKIPKTPPKVDKPDSVTKPDVTESKPRAEQQVFDSPQEAFGGEYIDYLRELVGIAEAAFEADLDNLPISDARVALDWIYKAENLLRPLREKITRHLASSKARAA
jgi:hypothetical protein